MQNPINIELCMSISIIQGRSKSFEYIVSFHNSLPNDKIIHNRHSYCLHKHDNEVPTFRILAPKHSQSMGLKTTPAAYKQTFCKLYSTRVCSYRYNHNENIKLKCSRHTHQPPRVYSQQNVNKSTRRNTLWVPFTTKIQPVCMFSTRHIYYGA